MKKIIYLLFFLITGVSNAQVITFTDNDFRLKLLQSDVTNNIAKTLGGNNIKIDADGNGQITEQEVALVYELSIQNEVSINNIDEIQFFVNLTILDAQNCSIAGNVDLSNLVLLDRILLNNNQITTVDVSGCVAVTEIDCADNLLQEIDVSALIILQDLKVDNNPILQIFAKNGADEVITFSGTLNQNINYICADETQVINLQSQVTNGCIVNSLCTSVPGGNYNTIKGLLLFDATGNGMDITDITHSYVKLRSVLGNDDSTNVQTVTKADGTFTFATTEIGGFDVIPAVENPTWFTITGVAGNFADKNNNVFNQNFLLAPVGVHFDVEAMIRPISQVIPGANVTYEIVFKNKGNQPHTGLVTFGYDESVLDFISSTLPLVNIGTGLLSLGYSNLLPFETRSFVVTLNLINSVVTGDILPFSITIDPNGEDLATQIDNTFSYFQNVIPTNANYIECIDGNVVATSKIGQFLHYAVNFENTGNQEAKTVVVKTFFDPVLYDNNSVQILSTSFPLQLEWVNEKGQTLASKQNQQFSFTNSKVRGPGGQGGILLKVKTVDTITTETKIDVKAEVFFDYDNVQTPPKVSTTDVAETTFKNLSLSQNHIDVSITLYPNPTASVVNIISKNVINTIELFDIYGRLLQTNLQDNATGTIDLSERAEGIYFIKITSNKGSRVEKIVKK